MDEPVQSQHPVSVEDLSDRPGFDENFLGVRVGIPALDGVESVLLPYTHFSVLQRLDKRLAAVTALGMDGTKLIDLDRSGIPWRLDPRLRADQQTGEKVYAGNDIDRGHLVRRASAVWGETRAEAARANVDTFHYTNAAPQAAKFNQGMALWLGLESYLQDNAADNGRRLVVFTGPIFGDADPPPLGPFRTFQVPIRDIAALTGLDLEQLTAVDRMPIASTLPTARIASTWRRLRTPQDLDLDFEIRDQEPHPPAVPDPL